MEQQLSLFDFNETMNECGEKIGEVWIGDQREYRQLVAVYCTKPKEHQSKTVIWASSDTPVNLQWSSESPFSPADIMQGTEYWQKLDPHEFRNNGLVIRREEDDSFIRS